MKVSVQIELGCPQTFECNKRPNYVMLFFKSFFFKISIWCQNTKLDQIKSNLWIVLFSYLITKLKVSYCKKKDFSRVVITTFFLLSNQLK